ncbi:MAG: FecR domain-containing protein, partial [Myxococcales bacterium]|nr:FecR domain-containing protein [Myxococcales bacterium]
MMDDPRATQSGGLPEELRAAFDHAELARGLHVVRRRLRRRGRARVAARALGVVGAAALAVFAVDASLDRGAPVAREASNAAPVLPLRLADGRELVAMTAGSGVVELDDGSRMSVAEGAVVRPRRVEDPTRVGFDLERGRVRFDIRPHGPRAWTVDAGAVRVRVLGTSFTIARDETQVVVEVHRGRVAVHAAGAVRNLEAGERFVHRDVREPPSEPPPERASREEGRASGPPREVEPAAVTRADRGAAPATGSVDPEPTAPSVEAL